MNRFVVLLLAALLHATGAVAQTLSDGPYVLQNRDGNWIALSIRDGTATHAPTSIGAEVEIPGVGELPSFKVRLRAPTKPPPSVIQLRSETPLFVMADTHGELEIAVALLRAHAVVDESLRWSFGKGHLAILGDVFDRGAHHTELLWLIYKLQAEAERAGGAVHFTLGNHESMVLLGDDRYLHAKYKEATKAFGAPHYAALWSHKSLLGQWLRSLPAALKIGDLLCLHGGLSPEAAARKLTLDQMNSTVRDALAVRHALPEREQALVSFVMGPEGPLWYRGYFEPRSAQHTQATADEVASVLAFYEAKKIVIGHTKVPTVMPLYDGKVIAVQVYPHRNEDGAPMIEGLLVEKGRYFKALADGSRAAL